MNIHENGIEEFDYTRLNGLECEANISVSNEHVKIEENTKSKYSLEVCRYIEEPEYIAINFKGDLKSFLFKVKLSSIYEHEEDGSINIMEYNNLNNVYIRIYV